MCMSRKQRTDIMGGDGTEFFPQSWLRTRIKELIKASGSRKCAKAHVMGVPNRTQWEVLDPKSALTKWSAT